MAEEKAWKKPIIVLVPGAWNTPGSFNLLTPLLETAGYEVRDVMLPSVGAQPPLEDMQPDVDAIRTVIQGAIDGAHDVLLLMHDYASIPGGEAVKGLDTATRARNGLDGGVTCLFYSTCLLLPSGFCLRDVLEESDHSWIRTSRDQKTAILERPIEMLCPEIEPDIAKEYADSLKPHSYRTFLSKTTWEPYREIPFFCLFCKLDMVIPLAKQKSLAGAAGTKFKSSTLASGHCPFLAQPEEMAKAVRRAAKESTYYSGVIARDYGFPASAQTHT